MYAEDDLLPISALQHLIFCERQCALIHLEQIWLENHLTIEGDRLHLVVDGGKHSVREGVLICRSLPMQCYSLGLAGRADVAEFRRADDEQAGVALEGHCGTWVPTPVEYKRGQPKTNRADEVQLCAQALCLEEMFGSEVEIGHIFYGARRRRTTVRIDSELRDLTAAAAGRLHQLLRESVIPAAQYSSDKCESCSLRPACLPSAPTSVARYLEQEFAVTEFLVSS